jgi:hypothetical protein
MPKFSEKIGNVAKFSSFSKFGKNFPPIKTLFRIDWNHIFQVKVQQKVANKKNTSGQNICPTGALGP